MTRADLEKLDGLPETEWTLGQVLTAETSPVYYEYDFGDGWTHRLEFVEQLTVPAAEPVAHVERGERRTPPEDCGGSPGHAELVDALADPSHERHQELTEWVAATAGPWQPFGWDERWIGNGNREEWTQPVRRLREQAQRLGLVRKLKGRLVLPVAVRRVEDDPVGLWSFVARSLVHQHRHDAERDATLLLALELAAGRAGSQDEVLQRIGFGLEILGWQAADGWGLTPDMVRNQVRAGWDVFAQLGAMGKLSALNAPDAPVPPEGRAFARAVLQS